MIIKVKLDVSKIDKTKLFKGEKGIYLDATIILKEDQPADSYGNHGMIVQDVTKAEREAGQKGPILGNVKIMGGEKKSEEVKPVQQDDLNSLPF